MTGLGVVGDDQLVLRFHMRQFVHLERPLLTKALATDLALERLLLLVDVPESETVKDFRAKVPMISEMVLSAKCLEAYFAGVGPAMKRSNSAGTSRYKMSLMPESDTYRSSVCVRS